MHMKARSIKIKLPSGAVSGIWLEPQNCKVALVFAHGAGADMNHLFMESVSQNLAVHGIATLRFNFPYMESGKRSPDPKSLLTAAIRAALAHARGLTSSPLLLGGKSLGGRMASWVVAEDAVEVQGLVFFGFPLHAPGKVSTDRADHLKAIQVPMLFLQGTRDTLADLDAIKSICKALGNRATLEIIEGGDHSFKVPAGMKVSYPDVLKDLALRTDKWVKSLGSLP